MSSAELLVAAARLMTAETMMAARQQGLGEVLAWVPLTHLEL